MWDQDDGVGTPEEQAEYEMIALPDEFNQDEAHARRDGTPLRAWSKVADLRERLRELKEPIYGDKNTAEKADESTSRIG